MSNCLPPRLYCHCHTAWELVTLDISGLYLASFQSRSDCSHEYPSLSWHGLAQHEEQHGTPVRQLTVSICFLMLHFCLMTSLMSFLQWRATCSSAFGKLGSPSMSIFLSFRQPCYVYVAHASFNFTICWSWCPKLRESQRMHHVSCAHFPKCNYN